MIGRQEKKSVRHYIYIAVSAGLLLVLILVVRGIWSFSAKNRLARENLREAQEKLSELETRETSLGAAVERLQSPGGLEAELRETYRLQQEGERLIIIVEDEEETPEAATPNKGGLWRRLRQFLSWN